jgi:predicted ArsR family transcriptional regulator
VSRVFSAKLVRYLSVPPRPLTVKAIAIDLDVPESSIREWLYEFQRAELVNIVGRVHRPPGQGRGLSASALWQWRS